MTATNVSVASIDLKEFSYALCSSDESIALRTLLCPPGFPLTNQLRWLDNWYRWIPWIIKFLYPAAFKNTSKEERVCKIRCWLHKVKSLNGLFWRYLNKKSLACGTSIIMWPVLLTLSLNSRKKCIGSLRCSKVWKQNNESNSCSLVLLRSFWHSIPKLLIKNNIKFFKVVVVILSIH